MRPEWRWALAAVAALAIGSTCADSYARLALPYYGRVCSLIAAGHPWNVLRLQVMTPDSQRGAAVTLIGDLRRRPEDARRAGIVVSRVEVGEVVETPIVFWALVLAWPGRSVRERLLRIVLGIPLFLGLEAATTAVELLHALPQAAAFLAGNSDPLTLWERWSRFLEAGGRFGVVSAAAVAVVASASYMTRT